MTRLAGNERRSRGPPLRAGFPLRPLKLACSPRVARAVHHAHPNRRGKARPVLRDGVDVVCGRRVVGREHAPADGAEAGAGARLPDSLSHREV
jgi:hypothetical protein